MATSNLHRLLILGCTLFLLSFNEVEARGGGRGGGSRGGGSRLSGSRSRGYSGSTGSSSGTTLEIVLICFGAGLTLTFLCIGCCFFCNRKRSRTPEPVNNDHNSRTFQASGHDPVYTLPEPENRFDPPKYTSVAPENKFQLNVYREYASEIDSELPMTSETTSSSPKSRSRRTDV